LWRNGYPEIGIENAERHLYGRRRDIGLQPLCPCGVTEWEGAFADGAGPADRERIGYLAEHLVSRGFSAFCFDFSGHGESTGETSTIQSGQARGPD
jgi:hypothetical protein